MPLTFTEVKRNVGLNNRVHIYDVTFDNSYPTGGEAVTAANFGLNTINGILTTDKTATAANNRKVTFNPTTSKLVVWTATGTEGGAASDQSAVVVRCFVYGNRDIYNGS